MTNSVPEHLEITSETTDVDLVDLSLKDPHYFGFIIDRYESKLHGYMKSISGAPFDDREDLLQEVFVSVYQNLHGYNSSIKFSSWIYRIAHNKTVSWWRKNKKGKDTISIEDNTSFVETVFNENNVEQGHEAEHIRLGTEYALGRMKDQYRQILVLRFWEGKSYEDIADITNSSVGTVGTRVGRAKKQFIKLFSEYEQT